MEALLKQDRYIVLSGLVGVTLLAWAYTFSLAWNIEGSGFNSGIATPHLHAWESADLLLTFVMWTVMMVAMMFPSAAPMVLMFATISRRRREQHDPFVPTGVFVFSYLVVWAGFSVLATLAQWTLHNSALLSSGGAVTSPVLGGVLLIAAGVFQWTPLKEACLTQCRSPLAHLMTGWREGMWGAFAMGARHGGFCLGCCWLLMVLLFVAGVMNLLWVAAIGAFVLLEKVTYGNASISRAAGLLFCGWGAWMIAGTLLRL